MVQTENRRIAAQAVAECLRAYEIELRWLLPLTAAAKAERASDHKGLEMLADEPPGTDRLVQHVATDSLRGLMADVRTRATSALAGLIDAGIVRRGFRNGEMGAATDWAIAWAEYSAITDPARARSKQPMSTASCKAALTLMAIAEGRREAADTFAWETLGLHGLGEVDLSWIAEHRWEDACHFLTAVVRYAVANAPQATGQHLADLREAAGSVAYYTAEPWQWAALGDLVAGWEPPEEPEIAGGTEVPAPSI